MTVPAPARPDASGPDVQDRIGPRELTSLLAMSMALAALGIDLMLPVLDQIRVDLGLAEGSPAAAGLVTAYFLGLAAGQLLYGPLADRFGRKPALFLGYGIYIAGALAATFIASIGGLFVARAIWGLGAAGPRVVTLAVVRDRYEGEAMSRAMSFIMAVFIIVPVIAPSLGAAVAAVGPWRWIFALCAIAGVAMAFWARRLPETLPVRRELTFAGLRTAARFVASNRRTVGYTLAMTMLYGVFTSYIASSEIIYAEVFDARAAFPLLFGGLALVIGASMLVNARLVERVGARRLAHIVLVGYLLGSVVLVSLASLTDGRPPLWVFVVSLALLLGSHGLLIPNLNTIAMVPMGSVAGTASSLIGAVQLAVGALLGSALDRAFNGTIWPLSLGFLGYGALAFGLVLWAERGKLFAPLQSTPEPAVEAGT